MKAIDIPANYAERFGMKRHAEARDLVILGTSPGGRRVMLDPAAAKAWKAMRDAAFRSGVTLVALSGFRSVERQTEIIRKRIVAGESLETILRTVAAPGYSEHHTGRAIDIAVPEAPTLTAAFAETPAFAWLVAHAPRFGFRMTYDKGNPHGIDYEPWHWCYVK